MIEGKNSITSLNHREFFDGQVTALALAGQFVLGRLRRSHTLD
jgi:hypothetical protein